MECRLERQVGRRWVLVQKKRINVRGGRYATKVKARRTGLYRVSVITPGATKRLSAVKWGVVERILWAWVLTIPITGLLGYGLLRLCRLCGA